MIKGHENETNELTKEELSLAKTLIKHFEAKTKENPVKAVDIVNGVNRTYKLEKKFTDVRLRKIINYYRVNAILPIMSNSKGYYVTDDISEINNMIESLEQRAFSIFNSANGLRKFLK